MVAAGEVDGGVEVAAGGGARSRRGAGARPRPRARARWWSAGTRPHPSRLQPPRARRAAQRAPAGARAREHGARRSHSSTVSRGGCARRGCAHLQSPSSAIANVVVNRPRPLERGIDRFEGHRTVTRRSRLLHAPAARARQDRRPRKLAGRIERGGTRVSPRSTSTGGAGVGDPCVSPAPFRITLGGDMRPFGFMLATEPPPKRVGVIVAIAARGGVHAARLSAEADRARGLAGRRLPAGGARRVGRLGRVAGGAHSGAQRGGVQLLPPAARRPVHDPQLRATGSR